MKCWKCGKELPDGTTSCIYCNASQRRPAPRTETGRTMRMVYDRFGCDKVLAEKAYLTNALGDVLPDSQKLRSQLSLALDAGVGRQYLQQLRTSGRPDEAFLCRVRKLLVNEAELSDTRAAEIMGFFDEMIGWELQRVGNPGGGNSPGVTKPTGEIPRPGGWSPPGRQPQPEPPQNQGSPRHTATPPNAWARLVKALFGTPVRCIITIACILMAASVFSHISETESTPGFSSNTTQTATVKPAATASYVWSQWSSWSTVPVSASNTREVETRQSRSLIGYYMVHYGTQQVQEPHYRMFRNYSISGDYERYGARESYTEKHLTKYVTVSKMQSAKQFPPNGNIVVLSYNGEDYGGFQMGTSTAYNFGDDNKIWYIESEDYSTVTEYRHRDLIKVS